MDIIIFILSTIGLTLIITTSYIFRRARQYWWKKSPLIGKLIKCPQCTGFWVGIFIQYTMLWHQRGGFTFGIEDVYYIIYGFIGSVVSYITYLIIKPLIDKYD